MRDSSRRDTGAEACLVAICAHLCLKVVQDDNFDMFRRELAELVVACSHCGQEIFPVRYAADRLSRATEPKAIAWELALLRDVMADYYREVAAGRLDRRKRGSGWHT